MFALMRISEEDNPFFVLFMVAFEIGQCFGVDHIIGLKYPIYPRRQVLSS